MQIIIFIRSILFINVFSTACMCTYYVYLCDYVICVATDYIDRLLELNIAAHLIFASTN